MRLDIWTVYHNPSDYPGLYVLRRFVTSAAGVFADQNAHVGRTLADVRRHIPPGLLFIPRQSADEPQVVETWL